MSRILNLQKIKTSALKVDESGKNILLKVFERIHNLFSQGSGWK